MLNSKKIKNTTNLYYYESIKVGTFCTCFFIMQKNKEGVKKYE